jgi:hypothetical protein
MAIKDPPKFTQIWIFGLKIYHLATLRSSFSKSGAKQKSREKAKTDFKSLYLQQHMPNSFRERHFKNFAKF